MFFGMTEFPPPPKIRLDGESVVGQSVCVDFNHLRRKGCAMRRLLFITAAFLLVGGTSFAQRLNNPPSSITVTASGLHGQSTEAAHNGTYTLPALTTPKDGTWVYAYYSNPVPSFATVGWCVTVDLNNNITVTAGPGQFRAGTGVVIGDVYTIGGTPFYCGTYQTFVQITGNP